MPRSRHGSGREPRRAADPNDARAPPARPDGRVQERRERRPTGDPTGRSHGTSAEASEEIAGRPGTTQHVPQDGVPPGAERGTAEQGGGRTEGGGSS